MKRYIFFFFLFMGLSLQAQQVGKIEATQIFVSYNKTTHLIFPTAIKYSSSVKELVILKHPSENILSIKADDKNFEKTNLNVATADGKFYAYNVYYTSNDEKTCYFIERDSIGEEIKASVNLFNQLHIVLPHAVKYIDYGAEWIEAAPLENIQNIIKVETFDEAEKPTNISVLDEKGNFYVFDVAFDENAKDFNIIVGEPKQIAMLAKEDLTDNYKEVILGRLEGKGRKIRNLGIRKNSVEFAINNIFIRENKLIFRFNLKNKSNVKYDIDYMKFYIIDKKQTKESALQEIEYKPLFLDNFQSTIEGKDENTYSVCFEKFTIPDKKYFIIEINERLGGRHIYFKINNKPIENAQEL